LCTPVLSSAPATALEIVTYQPSGHYWPLQWYELAIYVGAALVLGGFSLRWVRSRVD